MSCCEEMSVWIGSAQSQNTKERMEDVAVVRVFPDGGLFAVLDGHNGRVAVDFVAEHLPEAIIGSDAFAEGRMEDALYFGFRKTEKDLLTLLTTEAGTASKQTHAEDTDTDFPVLTSGVVVCVVLMYRGVVYTANVGDCRAIMARSSNAVQLTLDHNTCDPHERLRVGPFVGPEGYVRGLMVTRSLGNVSIKSLQKCEGQIADPVVGHFPVDSDKDDFILIASDGLYEVLSNDAAVGIVQRALKRPSCTPDRIAQELVDRAVARGSCDNVCACIVLLKQQPTVPKID